MFNVLTLVPSAVFKTQEMSMAFNTIKANNLVIDTPLYQGGFSGGRINGNQMNYIKRKPSVYL